MLTSSIHFVHEWREFTRPDGSIVYRPVLPILVRGLDSFLPRYFLVDSGADLSMAPQELCRQIGLRWQDGTPITLRGISQRKACMVQGRIHEVDILVPDADVMLRLPMVFARGNAPFVRTGLLRKPRWGGKVSLTPSTSLLRRQTGGRYSSWLNSEGVTGISIWQNNLAKNIANF